MFMFKLNNFKKYLCFFLSSIEKDVFPNLLKIAKVSPIFKSSDSSEFSSYIPISILPVFSKVLERIMYNKVFDYLHQNKHSVCPSYVLVYHSYDTHMYLCITCMYSYAIHISLICHLYVTRT